MNIFQGLLYSLPHISRKYVTKEKGELKESQSIKHYILIPFLAPKKYSGEENH